MGKENNKVEEPLVEYGQPLNFEKVWQMFQETDKMFKETDRLMKEQFRELDKKFQETDKKFQATDKKFQENARDIKKLEALFTTQWGKLMETLVEGDLVNLLKARGVNVRDTAQRVKGNYEGTSYEFDIIARNGGEVVIVEVKTTLRIKDVRDFIRKLRKVKVWKPELKNNIIYGAVAYLTAESSSDIMAANKGLFIIRATGNSASIVNEEGFKPSAF